MIDSNKVIELIRRNGGFKPNKGNTSYCRTYTIEGNRPLQAINSNHETWHEKDNAINLCVVTVDAVGERKPFEAIQYVYNCRMLDDNDAALINQAVQNIRRNKGFNDPLANTEKHAKVMVLPIYDRITTEYT